MRIAHLKTKVYSALFLLLFSTSLSASVIRSEENLVQLKPCSYFDELNTKIEATAVSPGVPIVLQSADQTTFFDPPETVVGVGLMPEGLRDWFVQSVGILNPATRAQMNGVLDVYGSDAFTSGAFVAHLFVRLRVENGFDDLQCAVLYWDNGVPASVAEYIINGQYYGINPVSALGGVWVGNGIGGSSVLSPHASESLVSSEVTRKTPLSNAEPRGSVCGSSALPSSGAGFWILTLIFFSLLLLQKYRVAAEPKKIAN